MAFSVIKTDGTILTIINDGTINTTSTPISLPGINYAGYGPVIDTNLVHMLENFADSTPPNNAIRGQLWYNTTNNTLYVCPADGETNINNWLSIVTLGNVDSFTVGNLTVTDNFYANNAVISNNLTANSINTDYLTVNVQANISNATVLGNVAAANFIGGTFSGDAFGLSNISAANIVGNAAVAEYANTAGTANYANTAGTVTNNAQPNITSVGALTSLTVTGSVFAGNLIGPLANGNSNVNIPVANGNINISSAGNANILVITGTGVNVNGTLNTGLGVISGNGFGLSNINGANIAGQLPNALVSGTVYTNAQPNITSVGILTQLIVSGNTNSTRFYGNAIGLTNIPAANISGTLAVNVGGTGGNSVLAAGQSLGIIGVGQTWQNMVPGPGNVPTRFINVVYQNTTGRPIQISISTLNPTLGQEDMYQISTDNVNWITISPLVRGAGTVIVPAGNYYRVTSTFVPPTPIAYWNELR